MASAEVLLSFGVGLAAVGLIYAAVRSVDRGLLSRLFWLSF